MMKLITIIIINNLLNQIKYFGRCSIAFDDSKSKDVKRQASLPAPCVDLFEDQYAGQYVEPIYIYIYFQRAEVLAPI